MTGDTNYGIDERAREALSGADLLLAEAIVHAGFVEDPSYGDHYHDDVPYTFASKHMTFEGGRAMAAELDAVAYRLVHVSHFPPPELAFGTDLAVDGERFTL